MRIFSILTVFLSSLLLLAPESQAAITIKLAHANVPAHPMGQCFELFKKDLEERSNGEFEVQIYDSAKYGNVDAIVQGLQLGILQMATDAPNNLSIFDPKLMLFDMPYLIPNYESADLVTDGPIGQELAKSLEDNNILGLGYIDIGFRNIFSNRPVRNLEDAKGLKIRATHSKAHISLLNKLGMSPTPIVWSEVFTALQQGTVDGIDIDLNLAYFNNFHETVKFVTRTKSFYSGHLVMASKIFWNQLNDQQRKWIEESLAVAQKFERETIRNNEAMILEEMKKLGVEVIELSPEEQSRWQAIGAEIVEEYKDIVTPEAIEQIRATVKP